VPESNFQLASREELQKSAKAESLVEETHIKKKKKENGYNLGDIF
jgi:hypothetical protein